MGQSSTGRIEEIPTGAALGADIIGIDLSGKIDDAVFQDIYAAWNDQTDRFIEVRHSSIVLPLMSEGDAPVVVGTGQLVSAHPMILNQYRAHHDPAFDSSVGTFP